MGDLVEFRVLGPLEVVVGGRQVRLGGPRPRAVLATLLVHAGNPVSAERLIDQVWGGDPPVTAATALQVHISALRKVLGDRLVTAAPGYLIRVEADELDAARFTAMAGSPDQLRAALALWRGEPYAGVEAGSDVAAERQRLTELRLSTVERWVAAELANGRHTQVLAELAGLVVDHPLRERLAGLQMLALYRDGRAGEALAAYTALETRLRTELGVQPGAELAALARAIERGDPTLAAPSSVPSHASRFIGRRHELEELAGQLGATRLLTVTGPGGAGKTRLALELLRDTAADHPGGVHVVELATVPAGSPVAERVAEVLTVRARGSEPLIESLVTHLHAARALILLDNCEHVIEGAAKLAGELLSRCAGLRILATSREPLGVPGERTWPLAGLAVPTEAVRLLADRGAAARPGFAIRGDDLGVAIRLCRRLDGLPLAIELAAAQLRALSLAEVADRLDRALELADARARTTPERHRTMRAAIDWGYHLLTDEERTVFRRLAVFTGGCRADLAERVTGHSEHLLTRLVDQSLLIAEPHPEGTRYRMLELIREYALERLAESGETAELRRRHAEGYADLAGAAVPGGAENARWLRLLPLEVPNFRAAVTWSLDSADAETALRIAAPLSWFWWTRGVATEALGWLRRAMAAPVPDPLRALALRAAATLARGSDLDEARSLGERSVAAFRATGDQVGIASALNGLAHTALRQRDYPATVRFADESQRAAEAAGDELRSSAILNVKGKALQAMGEADAAIALFSEARQRLHAIGERAAEAHAVSNLAMMARSAGDLAGARRRYLESLAMYHALELGVGVLDALDGLAGVELDKGRPELALEYLTVTDREWARYAAEPFSPDRADDRETVRAAALAALGERTEAIIAAAADRPMHAFTERLLPRADRA
jgi:predicted ATPase/DNA-binding SARP family transcriptional activator